MTGIPEHLDKFFVGRNLSSWRPSLMALFVLRHDGQILYRYPNLQEDMSVGALVGGAWQAAMSLSLSMDKHIKEERFRFSFDTSNTGIYVLPVGIQEEHLYMGLLYKMDDNPAELKNKLRILRNHLKSYLGELTIPSQSFDKKQLFDNITDEEMDQLFDGVGP